MMNMTVESMVHFCFFTFSVIRRLVSLLSRNACLEAEKEAAMKQAQSASRAAETLMKGDGDSELQEKLTQKEAGNRKITFIVSLL